MGLYPARAVERAMKIQEVILRALSGEILWMEAANEFLERHWIRYHNSQFTVPASQEGTAFAPYTGRELSKVLSHQEERVGGNANNVTFGEGELQIQPQAFRFSMAKCTVLVCHHPERAVIRW